MYRSHREGSRARFWLWTLDSQPWTRDGFTLIELLTAMAITAMLSIVLGGLIMAVATAREHTEGLEEATHQARAAMDRISFMVSQAGVYQVGEGPTTLGIAVVPHQWLGVDLLPDVLVVWSGGRDGGLAEAGLQRRLPLTDELLIYTYDPLMPAHLVEIAFPDRSQEVDFRDPDFRERILALIASSDARKATLCDSVRVSQPPTSGLSSGNDTDETDYVNIRFELFQTPSDSELETVSPGTAGWYALSWAQGIAAGDLGLRQATLRMEFQINRDSQAASHDGGELPGSPGSPANGGSPSVSIPFFGSASYRYVYRP